MFSAVLYDGSLVIAGRFTQAGGTVVNNIARNDGTGWVPLGAGLDGNVLSLAVYRGELIASGQFDRSGDLPVRGIARWNGSRWAPVGAGLWRGNYTPSVGASALAVSGDVLYAAGSFDHAGEVEARHVARWDGTAWSTLGSGLDAGARSLLASGGSLYVGGAFHEAGGHAISAIARWDGQDWFPLGEGVIGAGGGYVNALAEYRGSIIATGVLDGANPAGAGVAAWDGNAWSLLGGSSFIGESMAVHDDALFVGGYGLSRWDGSAWSDFAQGLSGSVQCLLDTPQGLLVGGSFTASATDDRISAVNIGIHNGSGWDDLSTWTDRMNGLYSPGYVDVRALASYQGQLVAAGRFQYAGSRGGRKSVTTIARWEGATWGPIATTDYPRYAFPECLLADGDLLYAGGRFNTPDGIVPVIAYDGRSWSALDTLSIAVACMARYRGKLYIGGRGTSLYNDQVAGVYAWDGARWAGTGIADNPGSIASVTSMVEYQGRLVVAGSFDAIGGVAARGVAAWDGSRWTAMDRENYGDFVRKLRVCEGVLYGSGNGLARWEGDHWQRMPSGGTQVHAEALECANFSVLVGGYDYSDAMPQAGVLGWDGQRWRPLGSGTNGIVHSLLVHDGQLYVGGQFTRAGDKSSFGVARWDLARETFLYGSAGAFSSLPNPFQTSTSIVYSLVVPMRVRATVIDLQGRRIATLDDSQQPPGAHVLVWDGHEEGGRSAPPGMYFVQLDLGGRIETRRTVRLR